MNSKWAGENEDPVVEQALRNFRASVTAWSESISSEAARSEAMLSRRRTTAKVARHSWRLAAGWALGCAVAAASVAGALYEREHKQAQDHIAAAQAAQKAEQQRLAAEQQSGSTDEDLLADVDSDISRAVPAAMEPLAQMMDEKQAENNGTQ
jgi:hypothetical protein